MSIINSQPLIGASGNQGGAYNLTRSLRFRSSASAHLSRTPASASNRKTWTWSGWVKRGNLSSLQTLFSCYFANNDNSTLHLTFNASDQLSVGLYTAYVLVSNAVYRDPSSWYHVVLSVDTTQATASNRMKIYINGSEITSWSTNSISSLIGQNSDLSINSANAHYVGQLNSVGYYFDGYLAEVNFIDGQALTPSSFGETSATTGVWIPKAYTGSYGTNGFYLDFEDTTSTTTLGYDAAGSNDWTVNNVSLTAGATYDSMTDVPTLTSATAANYATWNPLINGDSAASGNLNVTNDTARGTQELLKYDAYWEITSTGGTTTAGVVSGTGTTNTTTVADTKTYGFRLTTTGTLDYINITDGGSFTNITTGLADQQFPYASAASATTGAFNAGQRPFAATPPSGFKALNTFNLPTPTIGATASTQANAYFDAKLYTGTGSSLNVTGLSFQPDLVWIKERSGAADHALYDAVRGVQLQLESNTTDAETTETTGLTALNSDGFTVGALAQVNTNTDTYVAWAWDANGAGSSNTDGTITSTVSANTSAGFSIVTYTGTGSAATIGHGLGVAPNFVIVKQRNASGNSWVVYSSALSSPATSYLLLNFTTAAGTGYSGYWNSTNPTSSVISLGTDQSVNQSTSTYVAYCFAEVAGYSKFGSYTGNGSTDGVFNYLGFRPRFIMIKRAVSAGTGSWAMYDTSRDTFNFASKELAANESASEYNRVEAYMDILSNGFKLRNTDGWHNASGDTYIYAAFSENPFKYSNAR
jgi:hypothetical protein